MHIVCDGQVGLWLMQHLGGGPKIQNGHPIAVQGLPGNDVYAIHAQSLVMVGWRVWGDWAGRVAGAGLHTPGHGGWPHDGGVSPDIVTSRHNLAPIINLTFRPSASDTQDIDMYCHKWQVSFILPSQWPDAELSLFKIRSFQFVEIVFHHLLILVIINSLLPLGRYINMDPYPTWLLISWT